MLDEVTLKEYADNSNGMFAIMIENDEGEYEEYTDSTSWPTGMYFNASMSGCIDEDGNTIDGILTFDTISYTASVATSQTSYCYLYFQKYSAFASVLLLAENDSETVEDAISYIESKGEPDFSTNATTDEGLYAAEDDYGTSYYFRGAVEDNYVYFAGFYWRIIRINGDGSVRLIYDGTEAHENGESSSDRVIDVAYYNVVQNGSGGGFGNGSIGYMFGTNQSTSYSAEHSNTNDSTIKLKVDSWYETNILNKTDGIYSYSKYLSDTLFCNDRSIYSGNGYGTTETYYSAYNRLYLNNEPVLSCSQQNDRFTVSDTTTGNGALTYPIALITADEVVMAGIFTSYVNSAFYLYVGSWDNTAGGFWTMTPYYGSVNYVTMFNISIESSFATANNTYPCGGIRPVINLSSSVVVTSGDGTYDSPYGVTLS